VRAKGWVTTRELMALTCVSYATIGRDLDALASTHDLVRVRGGATLAECIANLEMDGD
jgi:DeoR/GlpR family transcriptional regulator of sugar metabolism